MYHANVLIFKREVFTPITDYNIPVDCCQNNQYIINFTTDDNISKFEAYTNYKPDTLYLTESMKTEWIQVQG